MFQTLFIKEILKKGPTLNKWSICIAEFLLLLRSYSASS